MAIPSIASYDFDMWRGIIAFGGPNTRLFEQGGIDGYGVVFGGLKTAPQRILTTARYANQGAAMSDATGERTLIGTSVTVVDQFGASWTNVIVMDAVVTLAEDGLGWMLNTTWSLLPVSS